MSGIRADDAGVASALFSAVQQIGGSIGTALLSTLAASAGTDYLVGRTPSADVAAHAQLESYLAAFGWSAVLFASGVVIVGLLLKRGRIEPPPRGPRGSRLTVELAPTRSLRHPLPTPKGRLMTLAQTLSCRAAPRRRHTSPSPVRMRPLWQEALVLVGLLAVYRVGRLFGDMNPSKGLRAGHRVLDLEGTMHLPREQSLQTLVLHVPDLVRAANVYYAVMHFAVVVVVLVWLHRFRPEGYLLLRRTIVAATAAGLLVQLLVPVSPPRMMPGFVDTGRSLGPSVYGPPSTDHLSNQFAAMPSLHVGWALAVALVLVATGTSRRRWLWVAHPVVTLFVVVVTGNHYWLDAIVGSGLVLAAFAGARLQAARHASEPAHGGRPMALA